MDLDRKEILQQVNGIFAEILDDKNLVLTDETTANDVEAWDSLAHIQLIVIEKHFKINFTSKEFQSWNNVGEMVDSIKSK